MPPDPTVDPQTSRRKLRPRLIRPYVPPDIHPHPKQHAALLCQAVPEIMFGGAGGGGKGLALSTRLPTPTGWTTMGDIKPGDQLFAADGSPTTVIAVSDVHMRDCFRIRFSDDSDLIADDEHRWWIYTGSDRQARIRRTPEFRTRRQKTRPKRGTGKKPWLAKRNSEQPTGILGPHPGRVVDTVELARLVDTDREKPSIAVAASIQTPSTSLPLDPYLLGLWLGDGSTGSGGFTTADPELVDAWTVDGWTINKTSYEYGWHVSGLLPTLRQLDVLGNKHIPPQYLRASIADRLALLQGLMDTDGTCNKAGSVEFDTTTNQLAVDVHELVVSLGWRATPREGRAKLYGIDHGPRWRLKWTANQPVFRLARKLDRQKIVKSERTRWRYVTAVKPIPTVPTRCITVDHPSETFLAGDNMIPTHNTLWMLMEALAYVDHPEYAALLIRRSYPNLTREPDGMIPVLHKWLGPTDAHWSGDTRTWRWPSGATLAFAHLNSPNSHLDIAGPGYTFIGVDESTEIRPGQYDYLSTRMRKPAGSTIPIRRRAASNPGGRYHSYYAKRFGLDGKTQAMEGTLYIPAKVTDNPHIDIADYYARLSKLDPVLRARIRDGDWTITEGGHIFTIDQLRVVAGPGPDHCQRIRAWDLAAQVPVAGSDPDHTVGTLVAVDPSTYGETTTIVEEDGTQIKVPLPPVAYIEDVVRIREHPDKVDQIVAATASRDGTHVIVGLEEERGGAGTHLVASWKRNLPTHRVIALKPDASKTERARRYAAAVGFGRVHIVKADWNDEWLAEHAEFPNSDHADQVDTAAYGYRYLADKPPATLSHRAGRRI